MSRGSDPAITPSMSAPSRTVRLRGPSETNVPTTDGGNIGTRPKVGLMPKTPQKLAGCRIEPPPSPPVAIGPMPQATAAADPPLDPAAVRSGFQGLRVGPKSGLSVGDFQPNSGVFVLPRTITPLRLRRSTIGASSAGTSHS